MAKDVCNVLGIDTEQIRRLDDDEKGLRKIQTPGGCQNICLYTKKTYGRLLITFEFIMYYGAGVWKHLEIKLL